MIDESIFTKEEREHYNRVNLEARALAEKLRQPLKCVIDMMLAEQKHSAEVKELALQLISYQGLWAEEALEEYNEGKKHNPPDSKGGGGNSSFQLKAKLYN